MLIVTWHDRYTTVCYAVLLFGYYMWDTANSQKNRFRMMQRGTFVRRAAFPQLLWGTLGGKNNDVSAVRMLRLNPLEVGGGDTSRTQQLTLLTDGWFRYMRKPHYTGDILMALSWGMICGWRDFLPYLYLVFFTSMIAHRTVRDAHRCQLKYGVLWEKYRQSVPYIFIPYII